jgi:hypothetical protein
MTHSPCEPDFRCVRNEGYLFRMVKVVMFVDGINDAWLGVVWFVIAIVYSVV